MASKNSSRSLRRFADQPGPEDSILSPTRKKLWKCFRKKITSILKEKSLSKLGLKIWLNIWMKVQLAYEHLIWNVYNDQALRVCINNKCTEKLNVTCTKYSLPSYSISFILFPCTCTLINNLTSVMHVPRHMSDLFKTFWKFLKHDPKERLNCKLKYNCKKYNCNAVLNHFHCFQQAILWV